MKFLDDMPLGFLIIASLTLGLAPFFPVVHIWEKLQMLAAGTLTRPMDIFDLLLHGTPWVLLGLKLVRIATTSGSTGERDD